MGAGADGRGGGAHPYVEFCRRRYALPLVSALALAALGVFFARGVGLDASTTSLLPSGTPTLAALEELERRIPGASRGTFLVASSDPSFNVAAAGRIREEVAKWPETRWAEDRRDPGPLLERRLQLLPAAELARLADDLEALVDWEECERLPGCANLDARPEIPTEAELDARFFAVPEVASLARYLGRDSIVGRDGGERRASAAPAGALCSATGEICAVEASFDGSPSDLEYAIALYERGEKLLEAMRFDDPPPDLKMAFAGAYRDAPLTRRVMTRDLKATSWVSALVVLAWLLIQFRGVRPLLLLALPLAVSVLFTLGVVGAMRLELNVVSAFTFAILVGVGVDFGIHLLMHYGEKRRRGASTIESIERTLIEVRGSMATAAFTTAFAFVVLAFAEFRGLSQLGAIAAFGVIVAALFYRLSLPPLVFAFDAVVPERRSLLRTHRWMPSRRLGPRGARRFAVVFGLAAAGLAVFAKDARFESDFRRLNPEEIRHGIDTGATLHGASGVPIYILADDLSDAAGIAREVERSLADGFAPAERILSLSLANFVPPDAPARVDEIGRMREALDRAWPDLDEGERRRFSTFRDLLAPRGPITSEMLPAYVSDVFLERDGSPGAFAVVYVRVSGSDAVRMEELSRRLSRLRERHPRARFASPPAVVGEIMPSLRRDAPKVVGMTLGGLFLTTWIVSRSLRMALLVVAPVTVGAAVALGLLGLFDVRINFYNMLIVPVSFGLGIDGAIYVAWAMRRGRDERERGAALETARRGVLASSMTTVGAFSSFVFASNPGLVSLGQAALITLGSMTLSTVLWLPALLRGAERRSRPG